MEHGQIFGGSSATDWYLGQIPFQLRMDSGAVLAAVSMGPNFVAGPGDGADYKAFAASYTNNVTTDAIVNAAGEEQSPPVAATVYYVYYCSTLAADPPVRDTLRLSDQAPMVYRGQYVLENSTAFGQTSPFLGMVYLDAGPSLRDDAAWRGVLSYYFRRSKSILLRPAYNDNNAQTNLPALNNAAYGLVNGGTGDTATWLTFGEDAAVFSATWCTNAAIVAACFVGIGDDSTTSPAGGAVFAVGALAKSCASAFAVVSPSSMGVRTVTMLANTGGVAVTFVADSGRGGAAADVPETYLVGTIQG